MKKIWMVIPAVGIFAVAYSASAQSTPDTSSPSKDSSTVQTTETTHSESGQKTKTKSMRLIGSVKSIDAGKSIVVTGPKDKDYSFNLDDKNLISKVDPAVAVGDKVRVVQRTDDAGMKTLTVAPYKGHRRHHQKGQDTTATPPPADTN